MRKTSKRSLLALGISILFMAAAAELQAAFVISSLDYSISPSSTVGKIGDDVLFQMAVLDATATYSNVTTVVSVTTTSIEVASGDFTGLPIPSGFSPLFIYDGVHTWKIILGWANGVNSVTLDNSRLIAGSPVSNYTALKFAAFSGATGDTARGAPPGSAKIDIGTAVYGINIYDDGDVANHNDAGGADGIYNGKFNIREAYQFNISKGSIVGHFNNVTKASNDPFISPSKINLDSVRPRVELVNVNPNPYNPNKELAQIFYYLTENSTVQLKILKGINTIKTLAATGYFGYNQPILWDGLDESGVLQTDGDYSYQFDITDAAGNTGATFTGILKLTTVEVVTTLYSIDSEYSQVVNPQTVFTAKMHVELHNATFANLQNLGFNYETGGVYDARLYKNYPWIYLDLRIYDSAGTQVFEYPKDLSSGDMDSEYIDPTNFAFSPQFQGYAWPPTGFTYVPFPENNPCSVTNTVVYTRADQINDDDWDDVFFFPLQDQTGGLFTSDPTFVYSAANMAAGTYVVSVKGILVGKIISTLAPGVVTGFVDCTAGTTTVQIPYFYTKNHAQPSYFYDSNVGGLGDERGFGVASQIRTASFMVEQPPVIPLPDNTPPSIVAFSEYPSADEVLEPGVIGPQKPVKITLTDQGVGAGPVNLSTFVLKDPYGNQVPGKVAWNAGAPGTKNWEIYYIPDSVLTLGGRYTYTVVPVDAAYNIGASVSYSFSVADTSIPTVSNVNVQASTGASQDLSQSTQTSVSFLVTKVQATLIPGGSALVDWTLSSLSIKDASGNTIAGTASHTDGTSTLEFTPSVALSDGGYTAVVTAVSANNYQGAYSYKFLISTANVSYVDLTGAGENDTTCMRISQFTAVDSGIRDSISAMVDTADFSVITVNAASLPANSTDAIFSKPIRFAMAAPHQFPATFNSSLCSAGIRIHYTDADVAALTTTTTLNEGNLTLWVLSGGTWTKITPIGAPVISTTTTDRYIEFPVTSIAGSDNAYALMYTPPSGGGGGGTVAYHFPATKIFNPSTQTAKIFYTNNIAAIGPFGGTGNVKAVIFAINGSPVRTFEYQKAADFTGPFNNPVGSTPANSSVNFNNLSEVNYYLTWDGKNDKGKTVLNGIYIVKLEITTAAGAKSRLSRAIAVVK